MSTDESNSLSISSGDFVKCPCCGQMTLKKPVKPSGELLDSWLSCSATGVRFSHTYPMYSGRVRITACSLDDAAVLRLRRVNAAADALEGHSDVTGVEDSALKEAATAVRLYSCITEIEFVRPVARVYDTAKVCEEASRLLIEAGRRQSAGEPLEDIVQRAVAAVTSPERVSALPSGILVAVFQTHGQFTDIMSTLGFDQDFWQGIELA